MVFWFFCWFSFFFLFARLLARHARSLCATGTQAPALHIVWFAFCSGSVPTRRLPSPSVLVPMVSWCDRRHFRGLHVRQSGKRSLAVRPLPCPSCSLNRMHSASLLHCVLRTRQRSEFTALQQRALPGGTIGNEGSSHCFKAWALNSSLSFTA